MNINVLITNLEKKKKKREKKLKQRVLGFSSKLESVDKIICGLFLK